MKSEVPFKKKFIWNLLGSLSNSLSSLILSICVNRILGGTSGGIFAFAYSNAQLMLTIGSFEVRSYQATDVKEKYSFNTYFSFRLLTCIFAIVCSAIYIGISDFSKEKSIIVFLLVLFKMVEAFTDVYGGRFQQKDRIDLSGKIFFVRVTLSTIIFICLIMSTHNLVIASFGMFLTSFLLFGLYDYHYIFIEDKKNLKINMSDIQQLLVEILPLFLGAFIMMYINNAPKYAINDLYDDSIQNIYNILFMPAFVINLFSIFMFRPMLVKMAIYWNENELNKLWKLIVFMYASIITITIIALVGTWLVGIPILSFLYDIDLMNYKFELMIVMLTGGISALMSFCSNVITIMRQQKFLLLAYTITLLYVVLFLKKIVSVYEILGAIISYGIAVALLVILFNLIIIIGSYIRLKKCRNKN